MCRRSVRSPWSSLLLLDRYSNYKPRTIATGRRAASAGSPRERVRLPPHRLRGSPVGRHAVASSAMTRFVVDCGVVLRLVEEEIEVAAGHELLAPTLLRSQTLSALHEGVHRGEIEPDVALDRLKQVSALPIRLLGDAVLRRNAWKVADQ